MKGFALGLGLGVALGVIFAPEAGEVTRKKVKKNVGTAADRASRLYGRVSQEVGPNVDLVAKVLNTASKNRLKRVHGIGDAIARRIVKNRPYASGRDIKNAELPKATIARIAEDLVENNAADQEKQEGAA